MFQRRREPNPYFRLMFWGGFAVHLRVTLVPAVSNLVTQLCQALIEGKREGGEEMGILWNRCYSFAGHS